MFVFITRINFKSSVLVISEQRSCQNFNISIMLCRGKINEAR